MPTQPGSPFGPTTTGPVSTPLGRCVYVQSTTWASGDAPAGCLLRVRFYWLTATALFLQGVCGNFPEMSWWAGTIRPPKPQTATIGSLKRTAVSTDSKQAWWPSVLSLPVLP